MNKPKRGLGRGLDALLGDAPAPEWMAVAKPIPISAIRPNPYQPRRRFGADELAELVQSVRRHGVLAPVLVRPAKEPGTYELVAGERRWRAAQQAGLAEIPAVVRELSDLEALDLALVENLQRQALSPMETALAFQRLHEEFGLTHQEIAERVGISRAQVTNTLRLLQLPEAVQQLVDAGKLGTGLARALVGLPPETARRLAERAVAEGWTARRMEREAKRAKERKPPMRAPQPDPDLEALARELSHLTGLKVVIRARPGEGGRMEFHFRRAEELDALLARLRQP